MWTIGIGDSTGKIYHLLATGIGVSISCGPYILSPGENLVASVTGGGASDNLTATLYGLQDVNPNTLTMDTAVGSASSVVINGGSAVVTITGTPAVTISSPVSISGTVPVSISSGSVSITGTVPVSISSGSVSITGTPDINILSQSVTVGVNLPWVSRGSFTTVGAGAENFTTTTVAVGDQSLGILVEAGNFITQLVVNGVQSGTHYEDSITPAQIGGLGRTGWITIPINAARDTTYVASWGSSTGAGTIIGFYSSGLTQGYPALGPNPAADSIPVVIATDSTLYTTVGPPVALAGNIPPFQLMPFAFGAGAGQAVIPGVAGQTIYLVAIELTIEIAGAAGTRVLFKTGITSVLQFSASNVLSHSLNGFGKRISSVGGGITVDVPAGACVISGTLIYAQV